MAAKQNGRIIESLEPGKGEKTSQSQMIEKVERALRRLETALYRAD